MPAQDSLAGKVLAVTGGASGIGLATAQLVSRRGATVCIADIDAPALAAARAQLPACCMASRVDVGQREQVDAWIREIVERHGRLDGAANVAGVIGSSHGVASVADLEDEEWHGIMRVNVTGTMYCLRAQLRHIADGGAIVNVSSIHGLRGFAKHAAYDASKHAIIGLSRAAALENGPREIRINCVAPGAIHTPLMHKSWACLGRPHDAPFDEPTAFERQGTAREVAAVIAFLLGPDSSFVNGSVYSVDGGWI
ncbi:hypothetical protein CDD81_7712 [Ophiocordyceps australis]|uniref:Uncharacterized protein n=1 Tax=Ophiocordyceps australis TaxID=1399860 RepID=A0A2C5Y2T8_9HYPO|nr:hypothetical protein CDD81_7712 [Ophiocordyceps australis]